MKSVGDVACASHDSPPHLYNKTEHFLQDTSTNGQHLDNNRLHEHTNLISLHKRHQSLFVCPNNKSYCQVNYSSISQSGGGATGSGVGGSSRAGAAAAAYR